MKKACGIILVLSLLLCSLSSGAARAESSAAAYEATVQVHDALPSYTIRVTDTGENAPDSDNILLAEILLQDGTVLQAFPYTSNETPAYHGVAALAMARDLNFDGYNDLLLLTAAGARNVFYAFSLWDVEMQQFRPVHQDCVWLREEARFSDDAVQTELCNPELFPQQRMLLSDEQDGFRYSREIFYMFDGSYHLTPKYIWDVYDAGDGMVGETLVESMTRVVILWDEQYPEAWYHGQDGVSNERRTAAHKAALSGLDKNQMRVANVDWVHLRKQDSKASPSLAKINAGESVTVLVEACGAEDGWVRVLYDLGEHNALTLEEYETGRTTMTGYIWHSFLEAVP